MKIVSQLLLVVLAAATLIACDDMGKGPSKPAASDSVPVSQK
jgi:hypothetical protein